MTGTGALGERLFATLSGGEKQRVIIAGALVQLEPDPSGMRSDAPQALLLDEPTASLDPRYQLEVAEILRSLNRDRQISIVLATHDLMFAASVCKRLALVREGEIIATGTTAEVLTPQNIERLYGIEADVRYLDDAGHLAVIPLRTLSAPRR